MTRPTEAEVRELLGRAADIFGVMSREGRHAYRPLSPDEMLMVSRLCEDWLRMRDSNGNFRRLLSNLRRDSEKQQEQPDA